ncbi:MAG: SpoIIE family protein phosphatase [Bacteriovoracaceae bacterium]|nr:SpoIIE family protein phosphatase [Bacteriovoracaceae bacterium]
MKIKSCVAETHQGPFLQINEDGYDFDVAKGIYFILDGFGGSGVGDKCVDKIKENIKKYYGKMSSDPDATLPFYFSNRYEVEGNALINSVFQIHKNIYRENLQADIMARAGASGSFVACSEELLTTLSIGNTMLKVYREGKLINVTEPDSFRLLNPNDHESFFSTTPLSGIGLYQELHFQVREIKLQENDLVLMMTDGVYARLDDSQILHALSQSSDLRKAANTLFNLSNTRGNLDNQTVMILQF